MCVEGFGAQGSVAQVEGPGLMIGFRVWGLGFRVWGLGFGFWGAGFRIQAAEMNRFHREVAHGSPGIVSAVPQTPTVSPKP